MNKFGTILIILISMMIICPEISAENSKEYNIMIVLDGSHNMNKRWGKLTRIQVVKNSTKEAFEEVTKQPEWGYNMGVRFYGEQSPVERVDCVDLRLGAKIEWFNPEILSGTIDGVRPKGKACLSHGLYSAQDDFPPRTSHRLNSIVLIASEADDCNIDEFEAIKYLMDGKKCIHSVHIVGLKLNEKDSQKLSKVAVKANGYFVNVEKPEELTGELLKVFKERTKGIMVSEEPQEAPETTEK